MATMKDLDHELMRQLVGTKCLAAAGFSIDANANDVQTAADVDYMIGGILYSYATDAAIDISVELATDIADFTDIPDGYTAVFVFTIEADGTLHVYSSDHFANADVTAGTVDVEIDSSLIDLSSECPFGAVKVKNASGSDFVFGTTSLATSGVTDTYYDLAVVPVNFN